jgi:uncharacterized membrane protein YeaQ/YmgE (transglycosylase-associated protein family)
MAILVWLLIGLIAGALARLVVPGTDPMGWVGTLILGLAGSLVGGFLGNLIADQEFDVSTAGLLGSMVGAVIVLLIFRSMRART